MVQLSNHVRSACLGLGVDFAKGGETGEPEEKPSKHRRDQLTTATHAHEFQVRE